MNGSFYGGRQGASFIISKSYQSIEELANDFQQTSCKVKYGEYAFIDNTDSLDNGKIYRRIYNQEPDYIGQILMNKSMNVNLQLRDFATLSSNPIAESGNFTLSPGMYLDGEEEKYNDTIQWVTCTVNGEEGSTVQIGIKIPYTIFKFTSEVIDYDAERTNWIEELPNAHPFYQQYKVYIPKGVNGKSITSLEAMIADDTIEDYPDKVDDISNAQPVLVYTAIDNGTEKKHYLGKYNMLEDIDILSDGTVSVNYTRGSRTFEHIFKTITDIRQEDNKVIISYNFGNPTEIDLKYPVDIIIDNARAQIKIVYNDDTNSEPIPFKYVSNITYDKGLTEGTGTQKLSIIYNDGTETAISPPINYIMEVRLSPDKHIIVLYSSPEYRQALVNNNKNYPNEIDGRTDWADLGSIEPVIMTGESTTENQILFNNTSAGTIWFIEED